MHHVLFGENNGDTMATHISNILLDNKKGQMGKSGRKAFVDKEE